MGISEQSHVKWVLDYIHKNGAEAYRNLIKNKLSFDVDIPVEAVWRVYDTFECAKHKALSVIEKARLASIGQIERKIVDEKYNKIIDAYKFAIIANNLKTATAQQHIGIDYLAIGTEDCRAGTGTPPTVNDTQLGQELYRFDSFDARRSGSTLVINMYLNDTDANPPVPVIASIDPSPALEFDVGTGEGADLEADMIIRVFAGTYQTLTIQSVTGDTVTLKSSTPLTYTTSPVGANVEIGYGEVGLIYGDATATPNSGKLANHGSLVFFKNSDTNSLLECHLNYLSGS